MGTSIHHYLTHLKWWHQMSFRLFKLMTCKKLGGQRRYKTQTDLPSLSYMMGFVPFPTWQTFSRMVVFPAWALPMIRIRKCGHRYCSLSSLTCAISSVSDCIHQRMTLWVYLIGLLNKSVLSVITIHRQWGVWQGAMQAWWENSDEKEKGVMIMCLAWLLRIEYVKQEWCVWLRKAMK